MEVGGIITAAILIPAGIVGTLYLIRKYREHTWGWVKSTYPLKDKIFIITGANTGLGFYTARALAMRGATVVMCCRNDDKANDAIKRIQSETKEGRLVALPLDLCSFDSIKECAAQIKREFPNFNCLINNAGLTTQTKQFTKENHELHFGVNHLGHFLLFKQLEDNIKQNNSRIVIVASLLHREGTIKFDELGKWDESMLGSRMNLHYSNSKLMNFYFGRELYKKGFDVHVLCPGLCLTDIFRGHPFKWYQILAFSPALYWFMRSAEQGAQNIVHAAIDNKNTDEKNPSIGYYIVSLKMTLSPYKFEEGVGEKLWEESLKMCGEK